MKRRILALLTLALLPMHSAQAQWKTPPNGYTYKEAPGCPADGKIYAPCEDQMKRFIDAVGRAREQNKTLVVIFGADWCPYCRGFNSILTTNSVLEHGDLQGKFMHVNIAVNALLGGKKTTVGSGTDVLRAVLAKAGTGVLMDGIPFVAVVHPKTDKRTVAFSTDNLEGDKLKNEMYATEKVRAHLLNAHDFLSKFAAAAGKS